MTTLIETDGLLRAWQEGTRRLLTAGPQLNVILSVAHPTGARNLTHAVPRIDAFLRGAGQPPTHTVAETIFPGWLYKRRGTRGVFDYYPEKVYPQLRTRGWGTYAYRLVRRHDHNGALFNPLRQMLEKMQSELQFRGPKRSCYEIGIFSPQYDLPVYDTHADRKRRRGGPCLSHLSFKLFADSVHLTALYRSHDYSYKVFGNLLGLARLQHFVARETRQRVGTLVVHSSYAFLAGTKTPLRSLLRNLNP